MLQVCPSLYRNEDALCTKINEQLLKARNLMSAGPGSQQLEKERLLRQTLEACKQVALRLDLAHVCAQLAACQFYDGVVELCCSAAEKRDPHRRAFQYYSSVITISCVRLVIFFSFLITFFNCREKINKLEVEWRPSSPGKTVTAKFV